jgi:lysophospholipase L1-like esterase
MSRHARQRFSSKRALLLRAIALGIGTLIALLVLELGLRLAGYAGAREREQRVFDARYGTVNKDSWIFSFAIDPARHRAVDLRGQLVPLHKEPGEQRVLFLGDSATEGAFVALEQSYPLRFSQLLRQRDPGTRVRAINAGVWGMTTIDEYHLLADKLLPLAPDVVVIGLFMSNDINFNLMHRQQRLHYAAPRWLDVARQHSALVHCLFLQALAFNQRHRIVSGDRFGSRWVPAQLALVDRYGLHMASYPAGELALYMRKPSALADEAFAVLEDVLAQFVALGKQHAFSVRVLLIPTPSATTGRLAILAHPDILRELHAQGVDIDKDQLDFALPTRRVLAICARLGLPCIDATPEFKQLGLSAFFAHDEHPTIAGHDALARALLAH